MVSGDWLLLACCLAGAAVAIHLITRLVAWITETTDDILTSEDYMGRPWTTIQPLKREDKPKVARPRDDMGRRSS